MLTYVIIGVSVAALVLLVIRFVQPELIYSVRRALVAVGMNKAFIDKRAGRDNVNRRFKALLVSQARFETRIYNIAMLQDRVVKISELYRLLDPRRHLIRSERPQVCIAELGSLAAELGRTLETNPEHNAPIVKASALLKHIADGILQSQDDKPLDEERVDRWFINNPISIEQVIEILIAAVIALAHRQQTTRAAEREEIETPEHIDTWEEIKKLEKRLRFVIGRQLRRKFKTDAAVASRVQEILGEKNYAKCLERMDNARKRWPGIALDFFEFLYLGDLETLIFGEWTLFQDTFNERLWLKERIQAIISIRNEDAHNRALPSDDDRKIAIAACIDIRRRIAKMEAEDETRTAISSGN
jgi:hypothetical protein